MDMTFELGPTPALLEHDQKEIHGVSINHIFSNHCIENMQDGC